jgi:hypothetical protein
MPVWLSASKMVLAQHFFALFAEASKSTAQPNTCQTERECNKSDFINTLFIMIGQ